MSENLVIGTFNSLANNKIFHLSKLKKIVQDKKKCDSKFEVSLGKDRKHYGKGENASYQHLLFPQRFPKDTFSGSSKVMIVKYRVKSCIRHEFNSFPNKPWFLCVCSTSLLKTLWKKEKLLVTSNFSFFHSVFCPFGELSAIFIKFKLSSASSFNQSTICRLGKG